nr:uncharacterized protein LOC115265337 isoform X2 [Aedes albopictus]
MTGLSRRKNRAPNSRETPLLFFSSRVCRLSCDRANPFGKNRVVRSGLSVLSFDGVSAFCPIPFACATTVRCCVRRRRVSFLSDHPSSRSSRSGRCPVGVKKRRKIKRWKSRGVDRDQSVCVLRDFSCRFSRDDYGDVRPKVWCVEFYDVDVLILYPDLNQEFERGRGGEANPCFVLGLPSCEGEESCYLNII